ncbi:Fanconi anemia core complex-associated protein 100 [Rhinophrynus dorsalis]
MSLTPRRRMRVELERVEIIYLVNVAMDVLAVYLFPSEIWHIELLSYKRQLYVLCARTGIYILAWDEEGRLLKEPTSTTCAGGVNICSIGLDFVCLLDSSVCSFTVVAGEMSGDPCSLTVEASLFSALFGVDVTMLDSSVILCGFPDGQVAYFPLKAAGLPSMYLTDTSNKSLATAVVIYHLEQPVVFIGAARTDLSAKESDHSQSTASLPNNSIVFLGHGGLMVAVSAGFKTEGTTYEFSEYHLKAPVYCAICSGSRLFYSTCSDILFVTVPKSERNPILTSSSHNISMVLAICQLSSSPKGDLQFLALSKRGKLLLCNVVLAEGRTHHAGLLCSNAGQRIKDLLSGIGTVSERTSQMKCVLDQRNSSLFNLNQAMALSRVVMSSQGAELSVNCKVRVSWTRILQQDSLVAICTLENKTDCSLESGWALCIHLSTEASVSSTSYSFPVKKLSPGETTELFFPLSTEKSNSVEFPIKISCTLFYSLKGLDRDNSSNCTQSPVSFPHKQGICLPLHEHTVDILQCLRLSPQAGHPFTPGSRRTSPLDPVEAFLMSSARADSGVVQMRSLPEAICNQTGNYSSALTASVRVSALMLNQTLQNDKSGVSLCHAVLRWLFSAEMIPQNVTEVHGLTPDERELCLRVAEVSVTDLSSGGPIRAIEVQMLSSHLDVLACLHLAVISRLQALVLQNNRNGCNLPDLNLENIQQQFIVKETLLKEVQTLRDSLCVGKELSLETTAAQRLLQIYRDLRDPGLLLL